jgi:hypothetical protein
MIETSVALGDLRHLGSLLVFRFFILEAVETASKGCDFVREGLAVRVLDGFDEGDEEAFEP